MWACCEFTRPMNSSMSFGLFPAAVIREGFSIKVGILNQARCFNGSTAQGASGKEILTLYLARVPNRDFKRERT